MIENNMKVKQKEKMNLQQQKKSTTTFKMFGEL